MFYVIKTQDNQKTRSMYHYEKDLANEIARRFALRDNTSSWTIELLDQAIDYPIWTL